MGRIALLVLLAAGCGDRSHLGQDAGPRTQDAGPRPDGGFIAEMVLAAVVIDGDTIIIDAGADLKTPDGEPLDRQTVRFIGVDAPEIAHPPEPADCYGDEAKAFTQAEIGGKIIQLSYDANNGIRDNFGRLLAYISRQGQVLNEKLLSTGHARAFRQFDHRERSRYIQLEQEARDQNLGLWACP
jgi:micrococcal nuclease